MARTSSTRETRTGKMVTGVQWARTEGGVLMPLCQRATLVSADRGLGLLMKQGTHQRAYAPRASRVAGLVSLLATYPVSYPRVRVDCRVRKGEPLYGICVDTLTEQSMSTQTNARFAVVPYSADLFQPVTADQDPLAQGETPAIFQYVGGPAVLGCIGIAEVRRSDVHITVAPTGCTGRQAEALSQSACGVPCALPLPPSVVDATVQSGVL